MTSWGKVASPSRTGRRGRGRSRSSESHEVTSAKSKTNKRHCFYAISQSSLHQGAAPLSRCCRPDADVRRLVARTAKLKAPESISWRVFDPLTLPPHGHGRHCAFATFTFSTCGFNNNLLEEILPDLVRLQIPIKKKKKNTKQNNNCTIPLAKCYY